jgi:hypothetical protein
VVAVSIPVSAFAVAIGLMLLDRATIWKRKRDIGSGIGVPAQDAPQLLGAPWRRPALQRIEKTRLNFFGMHGRYAITSP